MRHVWSVLCRHILEDKKSSNFSLIETLEKVSFGGNLPSERPLKLPLSFHIATFWRRNTKTDDAQNSIRLLVHSPAQEELISVDYDIDFAESGVHRTNIDFNYLTYTENGVYEFEISFKDGDDWKPVASIPLEIVHEGPPDPA